MSVYINTFLKKTNKKKKTHHKTPQTIYMMASYPAHNKAILLLAVSVEYAQKSSNTVSFFHSEISQKLALLV